ncbi:hypothetical protein LCGC14_1797920, partial [marine sediment metagenome]
LYVDWSIAGTTKTNNANYVAMESLGADVMIGGKNGVAQILIAQDEGLDTTIGDMTAGGNLAGAFDGNNDQNGEGGAQKTGATEAFIGKDWGENNERILTGFKAWGSNDNGFVGGANPTVTIELQGSTDNFSSSIVDLGNTSDTDGGISSPGKLIQKLSGITTTTAFRYHRLKITQGGGGSVSFFCAECEFYQTGGSTWTTKIDNVAVLDKELSSSEVSALTSASSTTPYSIVSPYTSAQAFGVHVTQSADVMYIAHKDIHPKKLSRLGATSWTLADVPFTGGPFLTENFVDSRTLGFARTGGTARTEYYFPAGATGTLTASGHSPFLSSHVGSLWLLKHTRDNDNKTTTFMTDDNTVPLTTTFANGAMFIKGDYTLTLEPVATSHSARLWRKVGESPWQEVRSFVGTTSFSASEDEDNVLYAMTRSNTAVKGTLTAKEAINFGIVKITAFTSSAVVTVEVVDKVYANNSNDNAVTTFTWAEGAWSDFRGYPRTVTFFEDRLWWASSTNNPDTIWGSKSRLYENHEFSDIGLADDALIFPLNDNEVSQIQWMFARQVMAIGAANKEYRFGAPDIDKPVTPDDRKVIPQTSYGSGTIQPAFLNDVIFFFQRQGRKLRAMKFDSLTETFLADDATLLAYTIFESAPVDMAIQRVPDSIVWAPRSDGIMPTYTYEPAEEVSGWATQIFGNSSDVEVNTGVVESVAIIHGSAEDEVWASVKWTIDSSTVRHIVRFKPRNWGSSITDAFFVDSGITATPAGTTVTGLDHLEGETVVVFGDGTVQTETTSGDFVVGGGEITVPSGLSTVQAGLPYTMKVRTMRLSVPTAETTLQTRIKRVNSVVVRYIRSLLGKAGVEYGGVEYLTDLQATFSDESQDTGENERLAQGGFNEDAYITIISSNPVPFTG